MKRIPASMRTREELTSLIEGRLSTALAMDQLVKSATRAMVEEALQAEVGDTIGRGYYAHGAAAGQGHRNGYLPGQLKTAEGFVDYSAPQVAGGEAPFRSAIRGASDLSAGRMIGRRRCVISVSRLYGGRDDRNSTRAMIRDPRILSESWRAPRHADVTTRGSRGS